MPNHFHLLLWPHKDGDLSRWMSVRLILWQPAALPSGSAHGPASPAVT